MEYSLRKKSIPPPSLPQKKLLSRYVKPTKILAAKSKVSSKMEEPCQATSETVNSDSSAVLNEEDTIGQRLCRRRSTTGNFGNVTLSKAKGNLGRKSCLAKISMKTETEREESPSENINLNTVNIRLVESACKSEVVSDVRQSSYEDTNKSNARRTRGRKSSFAKIALIPESGREESAIEAISSETLSVESPSKKSEVVKDFSERQPSSVETTPCNGRGKSGRKSCITSIILEDDCEISCEKFGLLEDSKNKVFENQSHGESSAERTKRRLVRERKEYENMEIDQIKLTRSNRKRRTLEAGNIHENPAILDHIPNETEAEVTDIDSKSASVSSPTKTFSCIDSSNQTKSILSCTSISSWEIKDARDVTIGSSQTSYSSFCKTKGTQHSACFKSRGTQTIVGEMVHKGTSTEDNNTSPEGDLMVFMLEAVKKIRESRCEMLLSSVSNLSSKTFVNKDMTTPCERSIEGEKTIRKKRRSGSKSKEKFEVKADYVIGHSSVVPIAPSLQVSLIAQSLDGSSRSPVSLADSAENMKKHDESMCSCELAPKGQEQPREERTEQKKLEGGNRREVVGESPISRSLAKNKVKGTNEKDWNVKTPTDKHETSKKICAISGDSSALESAISISVAVEERREVNVKDGQLKNLPDKFEKEGNDSYEMYIGSNPSYNVQRSKVILRRRTDSGSDEKVCSSSSDTIKKDGFTLKRSSSNGKKEDASNLSKRAGVIPSPTTRRSLSLDKMDNTMVSNITKRSAMISSLASRRSSSDERAEKMGELNVANMTPSPTPRRSLSVEKTDKALSSNPTKRSEIKPCLTSESTLQKSIRSFSDEVDIKESLTIPKDSAADVFVKPNASISKKEKRSSGKGLSEAPVGVQKVGNKSKLSPPISLCILKHQGKSGPSPALRRKDNKDEQKGELKGDEEVYSDPDSSTVDGLKQEVMEYSYNKDDDDDVLSLYPESEYAEMFGSLDNHLSNVSDSYIEYKCPSPSMNEEAKENCMAYVLAESGILSVEENEKQDESHSCPVKRDESHPSTERLEDLVVGEVDAGKEINSKPRDFALVEDSTRINVGNETLTVANGQNVDPKNDIQTKENVEDSGLKPHLTEEEELNFSAQICEEMKEVPKEVDVKIESDVMLAELQKQCLEPVTSSMDAGSTSVCEGGGKRSSKADNSLKLGISDRNYKIPNLKGLCFRFMRGLNCRCYKFAHKFPPNFVSKMEIADSSEVYSTLLFAVNRHLEVFLCNYGTALASILASRKEGRLLMSFLMAYAYEYKGSAKFWHVTLRLIIDCGNCCESSSIEVIMYIIKHILSDHGLSVDMYRLLVEKIISIACEFKDTNRACEVLEALDFTGVSLQESTVRKLLQLFISATTEADRSRISFTVASVLVVAIFLPVHQEDMDLFCAMTETLERNGHDGLKKELESKNIVISDDLQRVSDVAQQFRVNERSDKGTPRKQNPSNSVGLKSQRKRFTRISETEADKLIPHKRSRISLAVHDLKRRENLKNSYLAENNLQRRQNNLGVYSQHLENQHMSLEASSSSISEAWSPVRRYGPNDDSEWDRRDFEAAFVAQLSSPLPTNAHGSCLFPQGVRSQSNDSVNKSLPSSCSNEPGVRFWRSAIKKENPSDRKLSLLQNVSSGVTELMSGRCILPNLSESVESKQFRNCGSPLVRNIPSTASSEDTSMIEQNINSPSSSAISLSYLQKKPDSSSEKALEDAFRKSKWSPGLVLSTFSPWLSSSKRQVQLSKLSCKILEQDYTKAAFSLKSLLHCLGSQDLRTNKKFDDIKKILSTVIFNLILRMVISDVWSDAYKFLRMASSANLPIFLAEAFIEEEMSISRKFLVLSEICFRVNAMDEAIGYLNKGNLFGPVSCWKYSHLDGDVEIQITFLLSLLSRLASGGYSETAPSIFLTIYNTQKSLYRPVDLTVHVNKVILCALNGSCIKQAYDVYMTLLASTVKLPKTTYRALLIGLVSDQKYLLARNLYLQACGLNVYPAFKGDEIQHEITVYSYWQKEEIFIILDNAIRIMYDNGVKINPNKEVQDLEMNIHMEVSDTPEDLSVPWSPMKDDGSDDCQEPIPHSLALTSNSLEEAHDRVSFVLEQMFCPPILYDSIVTKEELEELMTLHPDSLEAHIYERFICEGGYCE